jgi:hypothetical protein
MENFEELQKKCLRPCKKLITIASFAGIAQLVERNLAKVEVESSRLFSRSKLERIREVIKLVSSLFHLKILKWCDSKSVMPWIANPVSPVRLWVAPPVFMRLCGVLPV